MKRLSVIWLLAVMTLGQGVVMAQGEKTSSFGRFRADFIKGCAPFDIHLEEIDSLGNISRTYTYEQGVNPTSDTFYTYSAPGIYEIVQLLGEDIVPKTDTLIVEVFPNSPPPILISNCDDSTLYISFPDSLYDSYLFSYDQETLIFSENSSLSGIISVPSTTTGQVQGIYQNADSNCQIIEVDLMPEPIDYALQVGNIDWIYECEDQLSVLIDYDRNEGQQYQVGVSIDNGSENMIYQGALLNDLWKSAPFPVPGNSNQICVSIAAFSPCTGSLGESEVFCIDATNLLQPIRYAYADYNDLQEIELIFSEPMNGEVIITEFKDGQASNRYEQVTSPFTFLPQSNSTEYHFELEFVPDCGTENVLSQIRPPFLSMNSIRTNFYQPIVKVPAYIDSLNRSIISENLISTGNQQAVFANISDEFALDVSNGSEQTINYQAAIGDINLNSNTISLVYDYKVFVPQAFSPNGDGLNDRLELYGLPTDRFDLKVFNRWGEKVFETTDLNSFWNGQLSNGRILYDTYVYRLKFYDQEGNLYTQQGSFVLISN